VSECTHRWPLLRRSPKQKATSSTHQSVTAWLRPQTSFTFNPGDLGHANDGTSSEWTLGVYNYLHKLNKTSKSAESVGGHVLYLLYEWTFMQFLEVEMKWIGQGGGKWRYAIQDRWLWGTTSTHPQVNRRLWESVEYYSLSTSQIYPRWMTVGSIVRWNIELKIAIKLFKNKCELHSKYSLIERGAFGVRSEEVSLWRTFQVPSFQNITPSVSSKISQPVHS